MGRHEYTNRQKKHKKSVGRWFGIECGVIARDDDGGTVANGVGEMNESSTVQLMFGFLLLLLSSRRSMAVGRSW